MYNGHLTHLWVVLQVVRILLPICATHVDQDGREWFTLMSHHSYVTFSPFLWNCTGDFGYRVDLKTRSNTGNILGVQAADATSDRPIFNAYVSLKYKVLFLTIALSGHSNIVALRHCSTDLADGQSHYIIVTIQCWPLRVSLRVDDEEEQEAFLPGSIDALSTLQLKVRAGFGHESSSSYPRLAAVGCFQIGIFENGIAVQTEVLHRSSDAYMTCVNQCSGHPCRHVQSNRCINFYNDLRCNCFGSGYDGSRCESDGKALFFDGKQQLLYRLKEENSQPSRIAITATNNAQTAHNFMVISWQNENRHGEHRLTISLINGTTARIDSGKKALLCPLPTLSETQSAFVLYIKFEYHTRSAYVKTKFSSTRCQFWLGDVEDILILKSIQVGMDSPDSGNFVGCIKEFYVDYTSIVAKAIDPYDANTRIKHPITIGCQDDKEIPPSKQKNFICDHFYCRHGTTCEEGDNGLLRCNCSGSGYAGRHCQFATLEKNCQALYDLGERRSGIYLIDPDGSGPLDPVYVVCNMNDDMGNAWTTVSHNFPSSTQVRSYSTRDTTFLIEYKYNVKRKKLGISVNTLLVTFSFSKSTWFRSAAYVGNFSMIGQTKGMCPCGVQKSCVEEGLLCNCDANSPQNTQDTGYNYNQYSGIVAMTFMGEGKTEGWADVTLGPLECTGPGSSYVTNFTFSLKFLFSGSKDIVQFTGLGAIIQIAPWKGKSILLWFRTGASSSSVILDQQAHDGRYFMITIENGNVLLLGSKLRFLFDLTKKRDNGKKRIVELDIQNNEVPERWHRITVEHIDREIRFTCDRSQAFYLLQPSEYLDRYTFAKKMRIGGDENNEFSRYFGCLMQLNLDGHAIDFEQNFLKFNTSGVKAGCQNFCHQSPCLNGGKCYEDYAMSSFGCNCQNPWAHIGINCETDINKDTDVAFLDAPDAYLTIRDLQDNALSSSIVFSFRTDQAEGLLLYAHDQFYNFIQVHLLEESKVVLTLNDLLRVKQCTVTVAAPRFNNLQWNQVAVIYGTDETRLCLESSCCSIEGQRNLQPAYAFRFNDPESLLTVIPPRAPVVSDTVFKYTLLYIGGLPSMSSRTRTKRQAVYLTGIKKFVGCMRGLRVGSQTVKLRNSELAESFSNFGLQLEGGSFVSFDMRRLEQSSSSSLQPTLVVIRFAFSSTAPFGAHRSLLVAMVNQRGVGFNIRLSELFLSAEFRGYYKSTEEKMNGKFLDGLRHFVYVIFRRDESIIQIDAQYKVVNIGLVDQLFSNLLWIGGSSDAELMKASDKYEGCISNVEVEVHSDESFVTPIFQPVAENAYAFQFISYNQSDPVFTSCASFERPPPSTTVEPLATMPEWNVELETVRHSRPTTTTTTTTEITTTELLQITEAADPSTGWNKLGVAVAITAFLTLLVIIIVCLLLWAKKRKKSYLTNEKHIRNGRRFPEVCQ
ncbi:axotactin isoform d, partial [Trichuris trichiura]